MEFKAFWKKTGEGARVAGKKTTEFGAQAADVTKEAAIRAKAEFDKQIEARNMRFNDPAFQEMLAGEKEKTLEAIRVTGEKACNAANGLIVRTLLKPLWESAKKISGLSKGKPDELAWKAIGVDIVKGLGSGIVNATQLVGASFVAMGRSANLGIRYSLAVGGPRAVRAEQAQESAASEAEAADVPLQEEVIITPAPEPLAEEAVVAPETVAEVEPEVSEAVAEQEVQAEPAAAENTISLDEQKERVDALLHTIEDSLRKSGEIRTADIFLNTYLMELIKDGASRGGALFNAIGTIAKDEPKYKTLFDQAGQALLRDGYRIVWDKEGKAYQPAVVGADGKTILKGKKRVQE